MSRLSVALLLAVLVAPAAPAWPASGRAPLPLSATVPATPQAADRLEECTIGVLSGSVTADGRPLLWKNRDSGTISNELAYFDDGLHPYITIINAGDLLNAWVGVNDKGFAVLNALSYNLPDSVFGGITNGELMKLALQTCVTVDDFEQLLKDTSSPGRENPANLAVIDAQGGATIFEVGSRHHHRFDAAADPAGFLVRANFSIWADTSYSDTWRFNRARRLLKQVAGRGVRRADVFDVSRDLAAADCNPYPLPFQGSPPGFPTARGYVDTRETIQRVSTVSSGLIQGVLPGEDPRLSTFFVALGQPAVTPFVPAWVAGGQTPPELDGPVTAPFCDLAYTRSVLCHDYPTSSRLINTWKLASPVTLRRPSLVLARDIERKDHARVDSLLAAWRAGGGFPNDVAAQEKRLSTLMYAEFSSEMLGGGGAAIAWRVSPNPMRDEVGITAVPEASVASGPDWIGVFDVAGRQVARLRAVTPSSYRWNGVDESGHPVPAGLYFGRSEASASSARILVVR